MTVLTRISSFVIISLLTSSGSIHAASVNNGNKLLVLLLDGFRWDYIQKFNATELEGFRRLRETGSRAERLIPIFPSSSYPNYYSLMTGLYPESHGMVDNFMYDEKHNTRFDIGRNEEQYLAYWWDEAEPLWITTTRLNMPSYFWYWPGCEVRIRNLTPQFCQTYQSSPNPSYENFTEALTLSLEVLRNGSAQLAGVYFERMDSTGHVYGPNSAELKEVVRRVDAEIKRVLDAMEASDMADGTGRMSNRVNFVIFADHGMAERAGGPSDNVTAAINLLQYSTLSEFNRTEGGGATMQIWPFPGREESLYNSLNGKNENLTVYRKADIPDRYHLKNHYRIPPIYLESKKEYQALLGGSSVYYIGNHGYDNAERDMHGIFFAKGPDFKQNFEIETLQAVDIYSAMCSCLNIDALANNGTWSETCKIMSRQGACGHSAAATLSGSLISLSLLISFQLLLGMSS